MNSKTAVERIMKVLGLSQSKFYEAKTDQGMAIKMEGELEIGQPIYISTEEGYIPCPPGVHKLDDGSTIEVDDAGKVAKIKVGDDEETPEEEATETPADETKEEKMSIELQFGDVKLKDGSVLRIGALEPEFGTRVKKVGYDGTLSAIVDGEYETANGEVLQIAGGSIKGVQSVADNKKRGTGQDTEKTLPLNDIGKATANVFVEAKTSNGVTLDSKSYDIGEDISVVKEDGTMEKAPDGEHEVILKDEKGNDVKVIVVVKDGKITERENVEEAPSKEDEMTEIASMFAEALKKFETKIDAIATKQVELDNKFIKFSKEPAGSRVFTQKIINEEINPLNTKYEGFRKMREAMIKN